VSGLLFIPLLPLTSALPSRANGDTQSSSSLSTRNPYRQIISLWRAGYDGLVY